MRERALLAAAVVVAFVVGPLAAARGNLFQAKLSGEKKVRHALDRLTFGARPGEAEKVRAAGLNKWIERQLHPEKIAENPKLEEKLRPLDSLRMSSVEMARQYPPPQVIRAFAQGRTPPGLDAEQRKALERLAERFKKRREQGEQPAMNQAAREELRSLRGSTPEESVERFFALPQERREALIEVMPQEARRMILARAPTEQRRKMLVSLAPQELIAHDLLEAKVARAVHSNRQLQEVLVDFWFNHFNVYLDKGADRYLVTSYERDAIRPHALGKFKDMLRATAEHPAMLFYLDNWQSVDPKAAERMGGRRGAPAGKRGRGLNENYARELLELHSLGVDGGYTQQDIIEVARCFTGWTIRDPQRGGGFEFNARTHDPGEKTVLGVKIATGGGIEDGLKVLDIVAAHPSTAKFLSRKLAQRFVADTAPDLLIARMAKSFTESGGDIRAVMRTMLASTEFWSAGAYRAKVKSPLEMVASAARALDADVESAFSLAFQVGRLGQPLYRKQEPTGYSAANEEWVNTTALLARMNFAQALTANQVPGVKVDAARIGRPLRLEDASAETRAAIARQVGEKGGASPALVAGLILGSPDFQRR